MSHNKIIIGAGVSIGTSGNVGKPPALALPYTTDLLQDLDADRDVARDSNGRVSAWNDQSGNANHATQTTDANRPSYTISNPVFNGHSSVNGDGLAYWMEMNGIATALAGNDLPFYMITVIKWNELHSRIFWAINDASSGDSRHHVGGTSTEYTSNRRGTATVSGSAGTQMLDAAVFEIEFTGTAFSMWVNGVEVATDVAQNTTTLADADIGTIFCSRESGTPASFANIDIARMVTFSTVPGDTDKKILRDALSEWYGGLALPYTSNLIQDLDAARGITIDEATGRVSDWDDQGESGNDASQSTDANQPAYTVSNSDFNGMPTVDGDNASSYWMEIDSVATALTGDDTPFYWIAAVKWDEVGSRSIWSLNDSASATDLHYVQALTTPIWRVTRSDGSPINVDGGRADTQPHIIEVEFSGTNAIMRVDGIEVLNDTQDVTSLTLNLGTLFAIRPNGSDQDYDSASIARISTFDAVPSATNATLLREFFARQYGIPLIHNDLPVTAGLLQDLDAARGILLDVATGRVDHWADQSGNDNRATQATDANQPSFTQQNASFRNKPSVNGDGSNYWMAIDEVADDLDLTDVPFYIIAAVREPTLTTTSVLWSITRTSSLNQGHAFESRSADNIWRSERRSGAVNRRDAGTLDTNTHIYEMIFSGTTITMLVDGVIIMDEAPQDTADITIDIGTLFASRFNGSLASFSNFEIARISTYTTIPSANERQTLRNAFSRWYGIALSQSAALPVTTGLLQDLDAHPRNIVLDGTTGRVEEWSDRSGNNNRATQTTDANQPVFAARNQRFNNKPSVNGDGIAYYLEMDGIGAALTGDDVPFYLIAAIKPTETGLTQTFWAIDDASAASPFHRLQQEASDVWRSRRDGNSGADVNVDGGVVDTNANIVEFEFTGTTTSIWVNGVQVIEDAAQDTDTASNIDIGTLFATRPSAAATSFSSVEIARVATFSTIPSDADKQLLRGSFSDQFEIPLITGGSISAGANPNPLTTFGANLDTWLRADVGISKTGTSVDEWADVLSGNGRTFSQSGSTRPLHIASDSGFHSLPTLDFDAVSVTRLESDDAASDWNFLHDGSPMFVWVVHKPDSGGGAGTTDCLAGTANSNSNNGVRCIWNFSADKPRLIVSNGSGSPAVSIQPSASGVEDVVQISAYAYEEGRAGNEAEIWTNNSSVDTGDSALVPSASDPFGTLRIGSNGNNAGNYTGQIYEVIICTAYPTAAQIAELVEYSRGRYY